MFWIYMRVAVIFTLATYYSPQDIYHQITCDQNYPKVTPDTSEPRFRIRKFRCRSCKVQILRNNPLYNIVEERRESVWISLPAIYLYSTIPWGASSDSGSIWRVSSKLSPLPGILSLSISISSSYRFHSPFKPRFQLQLSATRYLRLHLIRKWWNGLHGRNGRKLLEPPITLNFEQFYTGVCFDIPNLLMNHPISRHTNPRNGLGRKVVTTPSQYNAVRWILLYSRASREGVGYGLRSQTKIDFCDSDKRDTRHWVFWQQNIYIFVYI